MIKDKYSDAYAEVYTILQHLDKSKYNKIPKEIIEAIEKNRNLNYQFEYLSDLNEMEDRLQIESKAILLNIFRDYLANSYQKEKIIKWQNEDRQIIEEAKNKNVNNKKIFVQDNTPTKSVAIVEKKDIKIWSKILLKIKKFFNE